MMSGMGMMGSGFMGIYWILSMLVVIAGVLLIAWAVVRVVRRANGRRDDGLSMDPAIRVLKERYARGEIDREEYLQRLRDLQD
ncbi:MAG: SHOCT domain-containing protein [Alicyclobacillus sp.]|nr:SHOCT domain-containing protein [Alicyclobacillus sp.]